MRRTMTRVEIGTYLVRYRVKLEDEVETVPGTTACRQHQHQLLKTVVDFPDLLACGPTSAQKLNLYHNGHRWLLEAEAIVEEESPRAEGRST